MVATAVKEIGREGEERIRLAMAHWSRMVVEAWSWHNVGLSVLLSGVPCLSHSRTGCPVREALFFQALRWGEIKEPFYGAPRIEMAFVREV